MRFNRRRTARAKLRTDRFDLFVGWSVFSPLSEHSSAAGLEDLARVMLMDGGCALLIFSFSARFLCDLVASRRSAGRPRGVGTTNGASRLSATLLTAL
jgi:hypothetical protein